MVPDTQAADWLADGCPDNAETWTAIPHSRVRCAACRRPAACAAGYDITPIGRLSHNLKGIPRGSVIVCRRSTPNFTRIVAARSAGDTGLSVTSAARRSVLPWTRPPGTPAPAKRTVLACGRWSQLAYLRSIRGVRPRVRFVLRWRSLGLTHTGLLPDSDKSEAAAAAGIPVRLQV
jgi:hypothetical protein